MDLSILILTLNEEKNISVLLPEILAVLRNIPAESEIVVVDGDSTDRTREVAGSFGARVIMQRRPHYGGALREGLMETRGRYVITLDSDCSHPASMIEKLWAERDSADMVICSRYVAGGGSTAPAGRQLLSKCLNAVFSRVLHLPVRDLSSGFRLYHREIFRPDDYEAEDFDILIELLIVAYNSGFQLKEIPLQYEPRRSGASHAKLARLSMLYLSTLRRLWSSRNAASSADYDHRAYASIIPPQRYWQRRRFTIINSYLPRNAGRILDVACGSSRIIQGHPEAVAFDLSLPKLRFLRKTNPLRVCGTTFALPFQEKSFGAVIHSQLLEHVPFDRVIFRELNRVLKLDATLVIGTPDYGRIWWPITEYFYGKLLPNAYADEHITHYTKRSLTDLLAEHGFRVLQYRYICGGELIVQALKVAEC